MHVPGRSPYVVLGAGVHGLSTAYHLARELLERGSNVAVLPVPDAMAHTTGRDLVRLAG